MADHFALMAGRLLTESTLQTDIHETIDIPSMKAACDHLHPSVLEAIAQDGRTKSGVIVECRICQEEGDEAYMESPCSCKGSLKYAHCICIQRWCNEKGDTICEICLQQFTPNYSAPLKLFRLGRNPITFRSNKEDVTSEPSSRYRRAEETWENRDARNGPEDVVQNADQTAGTSSFGSQGSNRKGAIYCRVVAIVLMALLVLRDAISLVLGGSDSHSMALITITWLIPVALMRQLLMFRTAGVVIPVYIILISVVTLLHRHQDVHETEPGGSEGLHTVPPQQHVISIQ